MQRWGQCLESPALTVCFLCSWLHTVHARRRHPLHWVWIPIQEEGQVMGHEVPVDVHVGADDAKVGPGGVHVKRGAEVGRVNDALGVHDTGDEDGCEAH